MSLIFSSLTKVKLRKENKDFGSLMRKQEKKDSFAERARKV